MILLRLNTRSGVPPYLQIVQQIKHDIRIGFLKEGDKLPSVKEAVGMITVNPNTVFKAYRELENQGLVKGHAGRGIFVLPQPESARPDMHADLTSRLANWLYAAQAAGLDDETIEGLFTATLHNIKRR